MFFTYIDASGRLAIGSMEDYVLASLTVHEDFWRPVHKRIKEIKARHFGGMEPGRVEFHALEMLNRTGIYKGMSWDGIYSIFDDIFGLIADPDVPLVIISTLVRNSRLRTRIAIREWAYRLLLERLNYYLDEQNRRPAGPGRRGHGIMIMDTEGGRNDQTLRDILSPMLERGTRHSDLGWLVEDPLFTDSRWRNLSQAVDCVAYCVRKRFRHNTPSMHTTNWNRYYSMIEPKFHHVGGVYEGYGLKVFPSGRGGGEDSA